VKQEGNPVSVYMYLFGCERGGNPVSMYMFLYGYQGCQVTAVTASFLKCGSFLKLKGRENSWPSKWLERVLEGKMAVIWHFKKLAL
jgi:hypothetical protein